MLHEILKTSTIACLFQNLGSTPFIIFDIETTGIDFE